MRENNMMLPRQRGPIQPLPRDTYDIEEQSESPYYTIDNTEDIYGTTLLPSQRCYVDPWDLENYDYVRKKIDVMPAEAMATTQTDGYYDVSLTTSPKNSFAQYHEPAAAVEIMPRMSTTMPRPHTRHTSRFECQLECCAPQTLPLRQRGGRASNGKAERYRQYYKDDIYAARSELYGMSPNVSTSRYDDYMAHMTKQLHLKDRDNYLQQPQQIYKGYGGFSSSSSTEQQSLSYGSDELMRNTVRLQRRKSNIYMYNANKIMPQIDIPAPPPLSPGYDYCNPYSTLSYCSIPDCYECQTNLSNSLIYAAPAVMCGSNTLGRGVQSASPISGISSLYVGIYSNKFGLSKTGLLQIDYSCSWNDLDRVMGRNY